MLTVSMWKKKPLTLNSNDGRVYRIKWRIHEKVLQAKHAENEPSWVEQ